jgi:hypothetical protein
MFGPWPAHENCTVEGTRNVAACLAHGVSRLVYVSSHAILHSSDDGHSSRRPSASRLTAARHDRESDTPAPARPCRRPGERAPPRALCFRMSETVPTPEITDEGERGCSGFTRVAARTLADPPKADLCPRGFDGSVALTVSRVATKVYRHLLGPDLHRLR